MKILVFIRKNCWRAGALLLVVFLLTGCWSRHELDQYAIALGAGVDASPAGVSFTAQLVLANHVGSQKSGGGDIQPYWNLTGQGESLSQVVRELTHEANRELFLPHLQVLIFGQQAAIEGLSGFLDYFMRAPFNRSTVRVIMTTGTAKDVLDVHAIQEPILASSIATLVDSQANNAHTPIRELLEFYLETGSGSRSALLPVIRIKQRENNGKLVPVLYLGGSAFFKRDKLAGYLSESETRGALWLLNEVKQTSVTITAKGCQVTVDVAKAVCKLKTGVKNGKPVIEAKLEIIGLLYNQTGLVDFTKLENVKAVEEAVNLEIKNEINATLALAKANSADIYGFGELYAKYMPDCWQQWKDDWENIYPQTEVLFSVDCSLQGEGRINRPVQP